MSWLNCRLNLKDWDKTYFNNGSIRIYSNRIIKNCLKKYLKAHKNFNFFKASDGRLGWPDEAPYDVIHVGAASPVIPEAVYTLI